MVDGADVVARLLDHSSWSNDQWSEEVKDSSVVETTIRRTIIRPTGGAERMGIVLCPSPIDRKLYTTEVQFMRKAATLGFASAHSTLIELPGDVPDEYSLVRSLEAARSCLGLLSDRVPEVDRFCFVGSYFGAAIALQAASRSEGCSLVLWLPLFDGMAYLSRIRKEIRLRAIVEGRQGFQDLDSQLKNRGWAVGAGFRLSASLAREIGKAKAPSSLPSNIQSALYVVGRGSKEAERLPSAPERVDEIQLARVAPNAPLNLAERNQTIERTMEWLKRKQN